MVFKLTNVEPVYAASYTQKDYTDDFFNFLTKISMKNLTLQDVEIAVKEGVNFNLQVDGEYVDGKYGPGRFNGISPFMLAARFCSPQILAEMKKGGADPRLKDDNGMTALMHAARNPDPKVIKLLISYGIDVNAKDADGKTAILYAREYRNREIVDALIKGGASHEHPPDYKTKTVIRISGQTYIKVGTKIYEDPFDAEFYDRTPNIIGEIEKPKAKSDSPYEGFVKCELGDTSAVKSNFYFPYSDVRNPNWTKIIKPVEGWFRNY